ncbi:aspartate ammonia-lyase [bacterium M21]|nr:aspartate ammonia-lyase [bacterium M21]
MMATRTERDLLGELLIPENVLYGIQTERARVNFPVSGQLVKPSLIRAGAQVKVACAMANRDCGFLDAAITDAIISACDEIIRGEHADAFVTDALQGGAGTSTNMNLNEVIARRASQISGLDVSPHAHVNLHQSTNDVYPTAIKVAAIQMLGDLELALVGVLEALQEKEREFGDIAKLGRTQLRDAVPVTLGREFGAWAGAVGRDRWRISKCVERLRVVNLGGTAVGTGISAPRKYIFCVVDKLREVTGMNLARAENLVDATMNQDPFSEVSGILRAHSSTLCKIARDLRLLSSGPHGGLAEIELPAVQPGSSIMPGKVNPVIPEMVMQVAFRVAAHDAEINQVVMSGELELNAFMPLLADALLDTIQLLTNTDQVFADKCLTGITPNAERCRALMEASSELATALVPAIGHAKAVELARYMEEKQISIRDAVAELELMSAEELDQLLTPESLCALGWRVFKK